MADRKPISDLFDAAGLSFRPAEFGRTETEDAIARRGDLILYRPSEGKNSYVAAVSPDDIFDPEGNRFYQD